MNSFLQNYFRRFWENGLLFFPFFIGYAETHYRLKFFKPQYYQKFPEVIADVPIRVVKKITRSLPILIIIKDADLFPVVLQKVTVEIVANKEIKSTFEIGEKIQDSYWSKVLKVDLKELTTEQILELKVFFEIKRNNETVIFENDNFKGIKTEFRCYYSENGLPYPPDWFCGEPHFHSNFTSDQVEFGSDIVSTVTLAKAMGMNWFFVTDHSYDLDDAEGNYLKNDKNFPKWTKMLSEANKSDENDFRVIAGEEVSIGNSKRQNVHLLVVNNKKFVAGCGDSAEKWFHCRPQNFLAEMKKFQAKFPETLLIAAHPQEKVPLLQKILLCRGNWSEIDYLQSGIRFLQIVNNANLKDVEKVVSYWKNLLLKGYKFYILAGNDAHGNFNIMRQIKIPFWKLFTSQKQVFGKFHTVFHFSRNDPIQGIKNGEIIISNGPFLSFNLEIHGEKNPIGSTTFGGKKAKIFFEANTTEEFGEISDISLFIGDFLKKREREIGQPKNGDEIVLPEKGYLRMSLSTSNNGRTYTNPIWIE